MSHCMSQEATSKKMSDCISQEVTSKKMTDCISQEATSKKMTDRISHEATSSKLAVETEDSFASSNFDISNMNVTICPRKPIFMFRAPLAADKYDEEKDRRGREFIAGLRQMLRIDWENAQRAELEEERRMIGMVVKKMFDGQKYNWGKVVEYHEDKRTFKIHYEDDRVEEVNKKELLELKVTPVEHFNHVKDRYIIGKEKKRPATKKASNYPKRRSVRKSKSKQVKNKSIPEDPATYVPLAIRERKRDAYYYY